MRGIANVALRRLALAWSPASARTRDLGEGLGGGGYRLYGMVASIQLFTVKSVLLGDVEFHLQWRS